MRILPWQFFCLLRGVILSVAIYQRLVNVWNKVAGADLVDRLSDILQLYTSRLNTVQYLISVKTFVKN